jgi:hypothetical protein
VYRAKVVNKWKVGYRCGTNDIVTNIVYSPFLLLVYAKIVFIFSIELVVGGELT